MIKKINDLDAMYAKWEEEGRTSYFDKPEHIQAMFAMNKEMQKVRQEFRLKSRRSEIAASQLILID